MGREGNFRHDIAAKSSPRAVEHLVGELADRQHGVVSRPQLLELGLGRGAILHRLELRRLRPVHRGVYAVGRGGLSRSGFWMAAVLACGPCASLSHRSGAALWSIRRGGSGWIEVTAPPDSGVAAGSRAYRVTTAARTPSTSPRWSTAAPGRRELDPWAPSVPNMETRGARRSRARAGRGPAARRHHLPGCSALPLPRPARDRGPEGDPPGRARRPARPHHRTSCHSMTPWPRSSSRPPGSVPENEPKGWR